MVTKARVLNNGVRTFWWTGKRNFGDLFTPELVSLYGYTPIETPIAKAGIIGVGSLIHMIPEDYAGTLLGTGLISDTAVKLESAKFAAVRGELTKKKLDIDPHTPTGDLGLLAPKLLSNIPTQKKYVVGLVPHFVDKEHPWIGKIQKELGNSATVIDVQDSAVKVVEKIAECEVIVSSSLHGIIVADSLNIPNVWMELSDKVIGSGFKFWDYNSSIDYEQPSLKIELQTNFSRVESRLSQKKFSIINAKSESLHLILEKTLATVA